MGNNGDWASLACWDIYHSHYQCDDFVKTLVAKMIGEINEKIELADLIVFGGGSEDAVAKRGVEAESMVDLLIIIRKMEDVPKIIDSIRELVELTRYRKGCGSCRLCARLGQYERDAEKHRLFLKGYLNYRMGLNEKKEEGEVI
jgi:hypothetical protein